MMQLILIVLTKRKETIRYCELFGYSGQFLDKRFYRLNESQCTYRKWISNPHYGLFTNIPLVGFSLTSFYM
jgi:hypothetical protein